MPGVAGAGRRCLDINHGAGPDVGTYHCHPLYPGGGGERDWRNQQWRMTRSLTGSTRSLTGSAARTSGYVTFQADFHHFDHLELDLREHVHVRGAAFSCLRLKLADMVLI